MTGIWFLYVEVLGRVGVSGGSSEDLVLCRVEGSVGDRGFTLLALTMDLCELALLVVN